MLEVIYQSPTSASLFGLVVALLVLHLLFSSFSSHGEPPGPRGLPLIGNLFQVDLKRLDQSLFNLSKKYGPVFQVNFGPQKVVVLAGYRTVKHAMVNHAEEFGNRDITPIFRDWTHGHGIIFSNGDSWREMRRFALTTLKDLGMGRTMSQEIILQECRYLIKELEQFGDKSFELVQVTIKIQLMDFLYLKNQEVGNDFVLNIVADKAFTDDLAITCAVSNVISTLMYGKRSDCTDKVFCDTLERENKTVHLIGSASIMIYNIFPWLGYFLKNWRDLMKNMAKDKLVKEKIITDLTETLDPETCRCFVDAFLIRKKQLEDSGNYNSHYHKDNLFYSVDNLFAAGTDTTAVTIRWGLLYLAKFPHIQDRVQEELSSVVGSREVRIEDRKNLPYTDAVIHETQRLANIVPMALPHTTSKDVTFQGYSIKEGTTVVPLLTSVLCDESEWETPYSFNPFHFLDKEGKFIRRDAFMPFLAGRRACVGEGLAKMELFLFFASLLQNFSFSPPPGVSEDDLDLEPAVGLTFPPKPQQLCAISRH
ncbi:cytochrome P450 2K1 [Nothobranchius furzeri]|uniref:Cytochrome P450 2K1-like n=1 Tax=Nothobranchius furzeri TaxID=105023 RepID=A0A8C6KU95_NOTFU